MSAYICVPCLGARYILQLVYAIFPYFYIKKVNKAQQAHIITEWRTYYEDRGIPQDVSQKYMAYVERLVNKGMPVIFDLEHLGMLMNVKVPYLKQVINDTTYYYHEFEILKRSGGMRHILAPNATVKQMQLWIYKNILRNVALHKNAHAFRRNCSIVTNAKEHLNQKYLYKLDLKDFFTTIKINQVVSVFKEIGYTKRVSYYLAALCCYEGYLPQGAPTSPALSNIVCRSLDNRLTKLAEKCGYKYTRYADDIAFSGEFISQSFGFTVLAILQQCGFMINLQKVHLYGEYGKKILTGIRISSDHLQLPKEYKRKLRQELYYIQKYGIDEHMQQTQNNSPYFFKSTYGKVCFWLMIEPDNEKAKEAKAYLQSIKTARGY